MKQCQGQLSLFSAEASRDCASLFPSPESEEARRMTASSGLRCAESYRRSGPLGSLVRMCLGSSLWHSTRCFLIWKVSATPGRRLLYRLQASTPRTEGTELLFWPTPMASSWGGTGHRKTLKAMRDKGLITEEERLALQEGNQTRTNPGLLEWLMGYPTGYTEVP